MKFEMPEFTFTIPEIPPAEPEQELEQEPELEPEVLEPIRIEIPPMKIPPKLNLNPVIARIKKKTKSVKGIVDRLYKLS